MIDLFSVRSTAIAAAGYDPHRKILLVLYNTGRTYEYHNVPPEIFWEMMSSESKGRFLNHRVLGQYPYKIFRGWEAMEDETGLRTTRTRRGQRETARAGPAS